MSDDKATADALRAARKRATNEFALRAALEADHHRKRDRIDALERENERLREALEQIERKTDIGRLGLLRDGPQHQRITEAMELARAALAAASSVAASERGEG